MHFVIVETVTNNKFISDFKTGIICVDWYFSSGRFIEQRYRPEGSYAALFEESFERKERVSGIDDILYKNHVASRNVDGKIGCDFRYARAFGAASVRGNGRSEERRVGKECRL